MKINIIILLLLCLTSISIKANDISELEKKFQEAQNKGDKTQTAQYAIELADALMPLGSSKIDKNTLKKISNYYQIAVENANSASQKALLAEVHFRFGQFQNRFARTLFTNPKEATHNIRENLRNASELYESLGNGKKNAEVKLYGGKFLMQPKVNEPQNAANLLESVLVFADENKDYSMAREAAQKLADAYEALNNDDKEEYYRTLASKYTNAEKDLEEKSLQLAQQQKMVLIASIMAVFFLVLSGGAYLAKQKISKQKGLIQKEKEKSETLLLSILPKPIADELKSNGSVKPQYYANATVVFTDFKGFTNIAEQMSPTELVKELDVCFSAFDKIAEKHNMERIKTIGDAYMCVGGVPLSNDTHPKDAVMAAIEMQEFMEKTKKERMAKDKPYFELRVGIHTGKLVAGVIGTKKFAYDIWGDTVNIAARMESSGEAGKINISKSTYEKVKKFFDCEYRGKIAAKNKGEIDMYFVIGKKL
jgi:class 3 adenylate cyclase